MIDTISFQIPVEASEEFYQQVPYPIRFGKFTLKPNYYDDFVKSYVYKHQNLNVQLTMNLGPVLKITNSLHKYYKGNNHSDFSYSEIKDALFKLSDDLSLSIFNGRITRLDYGLNLPMDAEKIYPLFKSYKGKEFDKLKNRRNLYGKKVFLSQMAIKGYNKTFENNKNRNSSEKLAMNVFRFEIEVSKMVHIQKRKKPIPILKVKDLLEVKNLQLLKEDILNKYDSIEKDVFINFDQLTIGELKTLAAMEAPLFRQAIKKRFPNSYKKCRATKKRISQATNDTFFSVDLRSKIVQKLDSLINS